MFAIETQGAVDVIRPVVPLNAESIETLNTTIASIPKEGQSMIVIDLANVPLIDSAGLEAVLDIHDSLRASGGSLKLSSPSPLCTDILRVTGVAQQIEIHKNAKAAVGSFVK